MRLELITPQRAKQMLDNNIENNRNVRPQTVELYKQQMLKGNWIGRHPGTYTVNKQGKLLDGQHRLKAIVESGVSVYGYIATVDDSVMPTIDEGRKRTAGNAAHVFGIQNANNVVAAIRIYRALKNGRITSKDTLTNLDMIELYYKDKERIDHVVSNSSTLYSRNKMISTSLISALWMYFDDIDSEGAESFISQLITGRDVNNDTILVLRDRLIQEKTNVRKTPQSNLIALIIKTWNCCREAKTLKVLKFNVISEQYPIAI